MSVSLHWVSCDPARKGRKSIGHSVRVHLQQTRARSRNLCKVTTRGEDPLQSKARDIIGWYRQPLQWHRDVGHKNVETKNNAELGDPDLNSSSSLTPDSSSSSPSTNLRAYDQLPDPMRSPSPKIVDDYDVFRWPLIQYVTAVWLPSPRSIPASCHIGGHAPIYTGDDQIAQEVLRMAFQSKGKFFLWALSAFTSARMRFVSRYEPGRGNEPEYFAAKALKVLRCEIIGEGRRQDPPSFSDLQATTLGLAFLMLTTSFTSCNEQAILMYGRMMARTIAELGGVTKLSQFGSYFVVVTDFLTATANICRTSIRFQDRAAPQHITPSYSDFSSGYPSVIDFTPRHVRLQVDIDSHNLLCPVLDLAMSCGQAVSSRVRRVVQQHSIAYYRTTTCTIQPIYHNSMPAVQSCSDMQQRLVQADTVASHARYLAISLWLRLVILNSTAYDSPLRARPELLRAEKMMADGTKILSLLSEAQNWLQGTGWAMPSWLSIWITAVLSCLMHLQVEPMEGYLLEVINVHEKLQMLYSDKAGSGLEEQQVLSSLSQALPLTMLDEFHFDALRTVMARKTPI